MSDQKIYLNKSEGKDTRITVFILLSLTSAVLLLKFYLLFQISINQDEFFYLSRVYAHEAGRMTQPFQNFHVHFFTWLSFVDHNEVAQIIAARVAMYLLFLGSCIYIFLIGRYFLDANGASFSVLCYVSFLFTVVNGANFRADTICTFFFLFAVYHIMVRRESLISHGAGGLAMALSWMFNIKAAIHLTVVGLLLLLTLIFAHDRRNAFKCGSGFVLAFILGSFLFFGLHVAMLPDSALAEQTQFLSRAYSKFVVLSQLFPGWGVFKLTLRFDHSIWLLLTGGVILALIDTWVKQDQATIKKLSLFVLLLPLFSLLFYRNAYPYFYVFITPSATVFCGYLLSRLMALIKKSNEVLSILVAVTLGLLVFMYFPVYYSIFASTRTPVQFQLLDVVHRMFPEPVPYIDGCGMVSSFPTVSFFMSSAGMENYLETGEPIMKKRVVQEKPLFLLANVPHLNLHSKKPAVSATNYALLEDDWRALKSYFIHHWSVIWVVGKHFEFGSGSESQNFEISTDGLYTVEGNVSVLIDGETYEAGDIVHLGLGSHYIVAQQHAGRASLRWGDHLYRPAKEPILNRVFLGPFL